MNWRPKDKWGEIITDAIQSQYKDGMSIREIAEIGADAMLEALKKEGNYEPNIQHIIGASYVSLTYFYKGGAEAGWLVFIPGEQ